MYNVNANGRTVASESSYEKAVAAAKANAGTLTAGILSRADAIQSNPRLYRSPKARRNVAESLRRSAAKVADAIKFPKKAGDVTINVGGQTLAIAKA